MVTDWSGPDALAGLVNIMAVHHTLHSFGDQVKAIEGFLLHFSIFDTQGVAIFIPEILAVPSARNTLGSDTIIDQRSYPLTTV
jgi:hypothetical protein